MAASHGAHHGISYVAGIFLSVLLTEIFRKWVPGITNWIDGVSLQVISKIGLDIRPETLSMLLMAFVIIVLYGLTFGHKWDRKRSD